MGLNRLLKEGVAGEEEKLVKEAKPKETKKKEEIKPVVKEVKPEVSEKYEYKKNGDLKRKQYTITMDPEFYNVISEYRRSHKSMTGRVLSFAALIETALLEYMENHE